MGTSEEDLDDGYIENRHLLPYGTGVGDASFSIVDRAKEIEKAGSFIETTVNGKLELILKQIKKLQDEAKEIIENAEKDIELHKVKCNFEKKIGMTIHLYEKQGGEKYFSLISPSEWGNPPHEFRGSFKIKPDYSYEKIEME